MHRRRVITPGTVIAIAAAAAKTEPEWSRAGIKKIIIVE